MHYQDICNEEFNETNLMFKILVIFLGSMSKLGKITLGKS
jgi:hypothetical protein